MHEQAQHSAQSNAETQAVRQLFMIPAELQAGGEVRQQRGALALGDGESYLLGRRTIHHGEFAISSRQTLLPKKANFKASRLACERSAQDAWPTSSLSELPRSLSLGSSLNLPPPGPAAPLLQFCVLHDRTPLRRCPGTRMAPKMMVNFALQAAAWFETRCTLHQPSRNFCAHRPRAFR